MPIYGDIYAGPPRWYGRERTDKRYVAIHATANDASAEAEASWARRRPDPTSSHYYVDGRSLVQSLDTDLRAFHAGSSEGNSRAISYELTKHGSRSREWWLENIDWPELTAAVARDCREHNIVPRNLSVSQILDSDLTGFITHLEMGQAWGGTDHTDPGPNFPMDHLVSQVQRALEDDMATPHDTWYADIIEAPPGYDASKNPHWSAASVIRSAQLYARQGAQRAEALDAKVTAIAAQLAGDDIDAALARHRALIVPELVAALGPALAEELHEVPAERAEQALTAVLERTGLRVAPEPA